MSIDPKIDPSWKMVLNNEFNKPYFTQLKEFLQSEKAAGKIIFPKGSEMFNAFNLCPFEEVKVVILGQDPYHGVGQAHGLCFSVPDGIPKPPSLVNIFKELQQDLNQEIPKSGNLESWARQGVLLLNSILTVAASQAASHQGKGWEIFTDAVIHALNEHKDQLVFMLWGNYAIKKSSFVDRKKHLVLTAPHPSPLSAYQGFLGCKHFSKCNEWLQNHDIKPISW
jgi:uracil-DNA glycosylase